MRVHEGNEGAVKAKTRWVRIRPGYYRLLDVNGSIRGEVERGAETGHWWWWVHGKAFVEHGCEFTLHEAQDSAGKAAR